MNLKTGFKTKRQWGLLSIKQMMENGSRQRVGKDARVFPAREQVGEPEDQWG